MSTEIKTSVPAYTTYTAFLNLIKDLQENGIPSHITRSVVKGSNSGKATMMASLKYLGLIQDDGVPSPHLEQLVENPEDYSSTLKKILEAKYPFLFDETIDIKSTTTEKVAEKFVATGAKGSTVSKSMAFFLAAAKAAGVNVSGRVKTPAIQKSTPKRNKQKQTNNIETYEVPEQEEDFIPEGMERITVPLRGMEDGIIYFPENLSAEDAKRAIKMATFILKEYYGIVDDKQGSH